MTYSHQMRKSPHVTFCDAGARDSALTWPHQSPRSPKVVLLPQPGRTLRKRGAAVGRIRQWAVAVYRRVPILRAVYRPTRNRIVLARLRHRYRLAQRRGVPCRVVVGANYQFEPGWLGIEEHTLDITKDEQWQRIFRPGTIDAILAEHVWEHLPPPGPITATNLCFKYLKPGGRLRLAVPDGWFPDADYIEFVRPGGSGEGADDHHALYTRESLGKVLEAAGFHVEPVEFYDLGGDFHGSAWSPDDGLVRRSSPFCRDYKFGDRWYTSLILDGIKPTEARGA